MGAARMRRRHTHPVPGAASEPHVEVTRRDVVIRCADGRVLSGAQFEPAQEAERAPRAALLIASATGVPHYFYEGFARWMAARGFGVLTFDYRGTGDSAPPALRGFAATKVDWGRLDVSAAWARLEREYPGLPTFYLGHSVGPQLIGLMDHPERIRAVASIASGYGYWGAMDAPFKYFVWMMWHLGVPAMTRVLGYLPSSKLGYGLDLPAGAARDWARWGRRPDYFTSEIGEAPGFRTLTAPWLSLVAEDDPICSRPNVEGMMANYPNSSAELRWLRPDQWGLDAIGHLNFFSRRSAALWPLVLDWFELHLEPC